MQTTSFEESKAVNGNDSFNSSTGSLRSHLDEALSVSCTGCGSAAPTTKVQNQHQLHRVKFDDDDANDCCDSSGSTGVSVRSSGNSCTSLMSDYLTYEQAQEEKRAFHRNDRWSTSSLSPSSTRSVSPSPDRLSSRRGVPSPSLCSMPVRTTDDWFGCDRDFDGNDDDTNQPVIYYCPLTSSVSSERRKIVRRPRAKRENKWMASSNGTEQHRDVTVSSTSSCPSYSTSSTLSSNSSSSDLPPRMPRRRSLM